MIFPLDISDVSLLLALTAVTLLINSEFMSPYYRGNNLKLNRKRLRNAALTFSILFLGTVILKIITLLESP
jgi:hypothetical protein